MFKYIVVLLQRVNMLLLSLPFVGYYIDLLFLVLNAVLPLGAGVMVAKGTENSNRPKKMLVLYDFEACPYCRRVRETLTTLDLDVMVYPCPRETLAQYGVVKDGRHRRVAQELGGKAQFPLLVDENEDVDGGPLVMYGSMQIVSYLWEKYGNGATHPLNYSLCMGRLGLSANFVTLAVMRCLPEHGMMRMPSRKPDRPLELYSFEGSPFAKKVREVLCCLELPYILRNVGKYSKAKRAAFTEQYADHLSPIRKRAGLIMVPLLVDPNTGTVMTESEDIKQYLLKTYKLGDCVQASFLDYSTDGKKDD
eukprot:TRINITY_DN1819_c3_g1_i1.p1 TRINITY_DN1819_c3_g1~~TRINITY_DN1819_c3_g1_i1.p1  ORF type:complete len:322 (+),score=113.80 TRINITY_DN1819_c3_g1_i1:47-967(+)